jgi:uncharacterized membrane protein
MNNYIFFAFIIAIIWGVSPVLFKYYIKHHNIPTYIIILIQSLVYLFASLIYILIYKTNNIYHDLNHSLNHIPLLSLISLFSVYIANVLYLISLQKDVNVNLMSVFTGLYPILTLIFAFFILQETLSYNTLIGILLILIGILCIFYKI